MSIVDLTILIVVRGASLKVDITAFSPACGPFGTPPDDSTW